MRGEGPSAGGGDILPGGRGGRQNAGWWRLHQRRGGVTPQPWVQAFMWGGSRRVASGPAGGGRGGRWGNQRRHQKGGTSSGKGGGRILFCTGGRENDSVEYRCGYEGEFCQWNTLQYPRISGGKGRRCPPVVWAARMTSRVGLGPFVWTSLAVQRTDPRRRLLPTQAELPQRHPHFPHSTGSPRCHHCQPLPPPPLPAQGSLFRPARDRPPPST